MFKNLLNKKIKSIINENILYAFRENLLIWPILVFVILLFIFMSVWDAALISNFKNISYISIMWTLQYILWLVVIIYLSLSSFDKDIKTKNIYIILQQVNKREYFLWKLISIFLISWLLNIIFMTIFMLWYLIYFKEMNYSLFYIFAFQQLEFLVLSFIVALVSFLYQKNIGRLLIIWTFLILWHMLPVIKELITRWYLDVWFLIKKIVFWAYYIMPNLSSLNVKSTILIKSDLLMDLLTSTLYASAIIYVLYLISMYIFKKRDF